MSHFDINKPVEFETSAWMGKPDKFIFPTKRNAPVISKALIDFKSHFDNGPYFNISDVPCRFLDIKLKVITRPVQYASIKLLVIRDDVETLQTYLELGKLYLSGEAEIDKSLPADEFTDPHWILCNQICSITFNKLYWESNDTGALKHRKFTLLTV